VGPTPALISDCSCPLKRIYSGRFIWPDIEFIY
jgi:hypothetical protein